MSDLRAMLVSALGERRVGNMVNLHAHEVETLIAAFDANRVGIMDWTIDPPSGPVPAGVVSVPVDLDEPPEKPAPKPKRKPRTESDS